MKIKLKFFKKIYKKITELQLILLILGISLIINISSQNIITKPQDPNILILSEKNTFTDNIFLKKINPQNQIIKLEEFSGMNIFKFQEKDSAKERKSKAKFRTRSLKRKSREASSTFSILLLFLFN